MITNGCNKSVYDAAMDYLKGNINQYGNWAVFSENGSFKINKYYQDNNIITLDEFYGIPGPANQIRVPFLRKCRTKYIPEL